MSLSSKQPKHKHFHEKVTWNCYQINQIMNFFMKKFHDICPQTNKIMNFFMKKFHGIVLKSTKTWTFYEKLHDIVLFFNDVYKSCIFFDISWKFDGFRSSIAWGTSNEFLWLLRSTWGPEGVCRRPGPPSAASRAARRTPGDRRWPRADPTSLAKIWFSLSELALSSRHSYPRTGSTRGIRSGSAAVTGRAAGSSRGRGERPRTSAEALGGPGRPEQS